MNRLPKLAPFSMTALKILRRAQEEAITHPTGERIGTEHVLLGTLTLTGGTAVEVLRYFNINYDTAVREVECRVLSQYKPEGNLRPTREARDVIDFTIQEQQRRLYPFVETGHLLLGLIHEQQNAACRVLGAITPSIADIRHMVEWRIRQTFDMPSGCARCGARRERLTEPFCPICAAPLT